MNKTPQELSSEYYQFVNSFTQTDFEAEKILGKFYTDYDIVESMVHAIRDIYRPSSCDSEIRIIDPFCGDGRLVLKLLAALRESNVINGFKVYISL